MANNLIGKSTNLPLPAPTTTEQLYMRARKMVQTGGGSKEERQALLAQLESLSRKATKQEIAEHLAILLGACATGNVDLEVRARVMAEDVGASQPSIGVLELGCRNLRRVSQFTPTIARLLQALKDADSERHRILWKLGEQRNYAPECSVEFMLPEEEPDTRI
jgi:hypothetical protein